MEGKRLRRRRNRFFSCSLRHKSCSNARFFTSFTFQFRFLGFIFKFCELLRREVKEERKPRH